MAETKLIMPQMGESIFEGTLTKWLKQPGDAVKRDEPIFEISTDKIDTEIPSPVAGILQKILIQEGQTVEINTVVGIIGDSTAAEPAAPSAPAAEAPKREPEPAKPSTAPVSAAPEAHADETDESAGGHVSPLVRRLAKEHGINLALMAGKGTGINGRITKADILNYVQSKGTAAPPAS